MVELFKKSSQVLYLNSGSHSLVPKSVMDAVEKHRQTYEENPTFGLFNAWKNLWEVQKTVAPAFGADAKNFFLRTNVTQPLNEFILGIRLPAGAEILTTNFEYGAIYNVCRFRAQRDHLGLRAIALPNRQEIAQTKAEDLVDRVISAFRPETKMLVVSEIFTGQGLILPLDKIAHEARRRGIITVIDAAHSPGYLNLNLEKSNLDFYAGNLHKWWMGPKGTAFGWVHPDRQNDFDPIQAGWVTFETMPPFSDFGDGQRFPVKMLMLGCHDFSPFFALTETQKFWQTIGTETIHARKKSLDHLIINEMQKNLDLFRFASEDPKLQGPLHAYRLPEKWQSTIPMKIIAAILEKTQVQVSVTMIEKENYLRLSPHIYNSEQEIQQAVQKLTTFLQK